MHADSTLAMRDMSTNLNTKLFHVLSHTTAWGNNTEALLT